MLVCPACLKSYKMLSMFVSFVFAAFGRVSVFVSSSECLKVHVEKCIKPCMFLRCKNFCCIKMCVCFQANHCEIPIAEEFLNGEKKVFDSIIDRKYFFYY